MTSSSLPLAEIQAAPLSLTLYWQSPATSPGPTPLWMPRLLSALPSFCEATMAVLIAANIPQPLGLTPDGHQTWEVDVTLVDDTHMATLNATYRDKTGATDVLTFSLFAESPERGLWAALPVVQLGSVILSADWAEAHVADDPAHGGDVVRYLCERLAHGLLHLLGQHHDTMAEYHHVVALQAQALAQGGFPPIEPIA